MQDTVCGKARRGKVGPLAEWRLRRVLAFVDDNLDRRITLADLAGAAGLSAMHFAAQFRMATGCRPHDYLLRRRIEHAQAAIMAGRISLSETALVVGFQSQSHFTSVFKRVTGDTPARWAKDAVAVGERGSHCGLTRDRQTWSLKP